MSPVNIFDDAVIRECARQTELKKAGKFQLEIGEPGCSVFQSVSILTEELGEVARAVNERDRENLKEELVQVAACCRKWFHHLEQEELLEDPNSRI